MIRDTLLPALAVLLLAGLSPPASAQTPLSGNISDGAGGPLLSGTVYTVASSFSVPTGTTLTVQSGAIVKFSPSAFVQINGTLNVTASAGSPATFTANSDDTVGGDTNGDGGATTPAPGHWNAVFFTGGSDASTLNGLVIRYTGSSSNAAVHLTSADIAMTDCTVEFASNAGLDCNATSSPTVTGCSFVGNGLEAVREVKLTDVPGFTNNTASGNAGGDYIMVAATSGIATAVSITTANVIGGALVLGGVQTVGASGSLTVGPGVVFKFLGNNFFDFSGPLFANGTAGSPVVVTAYTDDDHGGDTNGDGPSNGTPGAWNTVIFRAGATASVLQHMIVRYAGSSSNGAIDLSSADISLSNCTIENCSSEAIDCSVTSRPIVTDCTFDSNVIAVKRVLADSVPGFMNNTAVNNVGNYMEVASNSIATTVTIKPENVLGGALVCSGGITVSGTGSLTLDPGVVIKFAGNSVFDCFGPLMVNATAGNPAVVTTFTDDSVGGDTNNDGSATTPVPGSWNALIFRAGATTSVLQGLVVKYSGSSSNGCIELSSSDVTMIDCIVRDGDSSGLDVAVSSSPTVTNCDFINNTGIAVTGVPLQIVPNFTGCTASGNGGNYILLTSTTVNAPTTITPANVIGGALVLSSGVVVMAPLNVAAGVVFKFQGNLVFDLRAPLIATGTTGNRVVFTSFEDDSEGGDTNNDGPSGGTTGSWNTMIFRSGAIGSVLDLVTVKFGGSASNGAIELSLTDITMDRCTVSRSGNAGLDLGSNSTATVTSCNFNDNLRPITGVTWPALSGFRHNTATGNSLGDHIVMGSSVITAGTRVEAFNYPGDALVVNASMSVNPGVDFTLGRGVNLKFDGALLFDVFGTLNVLGSGFDPVILTSFADDTVGGDSNLDGGATTPSPGDWNRLLLRTTASGFITNLHCRYSGSSIAAVDIQGAPRIRNLRVDHSATDGVEVDNHLGPIENWVVFNAIGPGIDVNGAGLQVINATVVGCGGVGIDRGPATGTVHNTIAWNNAGGGLTGYGAGDVFNCDADLVFAGMNGNISTDPLFVDELNGDLNLTAASPCIGAADPVLAATLITDHDDFSRLLDDDLDGLPFADMGAHERDLYVTTFTGKPRMGTVMTFGADVSNGPPGFAILIVGVLDGADFILPYGFITVGALASILPGPQIALGESIIANLPFDPGLDGFTFSVQAFVLVSGNPFVGQVTNRYVGSLYL